MLAGKKILLAITASIAAYKSAMLVRLLVKSGAHVKVLMTPDAHSFVTPLTLSTLSKNPVLTEFTNGSEGLWNNHVEMGLWADVMLIAPASANTLAKMSNGMCDNLVLAAYLSAKCPVFIAPAMDLDMHHHPASQENRARLKQFGNHIIESKYGELASGLIGEGRMAEPEEIVENLIQFFLISLPLRGKKALVTAGPTYEAIDAVRFIGNHSSGKMGIAIAEELARQGASVDLVIGPSSEVCENREIKRMDVVSAEQMFKACDARFKNADIAVLSAAVADFKPVTVSLKKIKKSSGFKEIELEETVDILASLGKKKRKNQVLVGFALETDNEMENAQKKINNKNLDFVVLNSLNDKGAGFKGDQNKITIIDKHNKVNHFELKSKKKAAEDIVQKIIETI